MKALAEALRFLSIIPVPGKPPKNNATVIVAYPWAGLILGLLTALSAALGSLFLGALGTAVLVTATRVGLTGALHLDGVADLADGIGGGRDREHRLAIMADSRIGTFGTMALFLITAMQTALIFELITAFSGAAGIDGTAVANIVPSPGSVGSAGTVGTTSAAASAPVFGWLPLSALLPIVVSPVLSRGIIPLLMRVFPSARPGGMGQRNKSVVNGRIVIAALCSSAVLAFVLIGVSGLIVTALLLVVMLLIAKSVSRQLGGLTGDVYGALIELGDLASFVMFLIIVRLDFLNPGPLSNLLY